MLEATEESGLAGVHVEDRGARPAGLGRGPQPVEDQVRRQPEQRDVLRLAGSPSAPLATATAPRPAARTAEILRAAGNAAPPRPVSPAAPISSMSLAPRGGSWPCTRRWSARDSPTGWPSAIAASSRGRPVAAAGRGGAAVTGGAIAGLIAHRSRRERGPSAPVRARPRRARGPAARRDRAPAA